MSRKLARDLQAPTFKTPYNIPVALADGKTRDSVTEYTVLNTTTGTNHHEQALFLLLDIESPVIFGIPWLRQHNPQIDWAEMTVSFKSDHCRRHCMSQPPSAPPNVDLVRLRPRTYKSPTVEDIPEDEGYFSDDNHATEMDLEQTLTPGLDHFRTRRTMSPDASITQARMIPTPLPKHPIPVIKTAGSRRPKPPPSKPPLPQLSAPIPPPSREASGPRQRPRTDDIKLLGATGFLTFCRDRQVEAIRV
ncbi:MAG: hypothetical protein JWP34_5373, partial [Massilia sp.]|nr:hypothetical protein [Massilia sp.]